MSVWYIAQYGQLELIIPAGCAYPFELPIIIVRYHAQVVASNHDEFPLEMLIFLPGSDYTSFSGELTSVDAYFASARRLQRCPARHL